MSNPLISIIIPTYNRPHLLPGAVRSALAQTVEDLEVIVVDDGSPDSVKLRDHPQLKLIRLHKNSGGAVARNVGAKAARGRYISYLDDDDQLLPHMAQVSLEALASTTLPQPVAVLSGMEVVGKNGRIIQKRIPPTLLRGSHFCLEKIEPGQSFHTKQTMVVEREVLLSIGGFDESFTSRIHTELFLRLNPVCSLLGLPTVTYRLTKHGQQVSSNLSLRQTNFNRLLDKHRPLFEAHPKMYANFIFDHAMKLYQLGQIPAAIKSFSWAMSVDPLHTFACITSSGRRLVRGVPSQSWRDFSRGV
ncbi:MAG: glycosyltransferase family 2 protein [Cyanophyceae cyanobacterium]